MLPSVASACCKLMDPLSSYPIAVPPIQNSAGVSQLTSDLVIEGARERCHRCMSDTVHHVGGAGGGRSYIVWGREGLRWFDPEMMMCVLRSINLRTRSNPLLESKLNHCRPVDHETVVVITFTCSKSRWKERVILEGAQRFRGRTRSDPGTFAQ